MIMKKIFIYILIFSLFSNCGLLFAKKDGFTQADRERLIRLETTLKVFMEQTNKRFAELREDINKRFEQVNARFLDMQKNIDNRFEQVDKRFEQVDKRFEQVDKRFESIDNQFDRLTNFLWMIVAIFTAIMVGSIGFAYWDRMTIVRKAKNDTIEDIEREGRLRDVIKALRDHAKVNPDIRKVLEDYHLL